MLTNCIYRRLIYKSYISNLQIKILFLEHQEDSYWLVATSLPPVLSGYPDNNQKVARDHGIRTRDFMWYALMH